MFWSRHFSVRVNRRRQRSKANMNMVLGRRPLVVEHLERRELLSVTSPVAQNDVRAVTSAIGTWYSSTSLSTGATPTQIKHAYGFDQLSATGSGQTIAIVDFYHDPTITTDLQQFDTQFGLPAANVTQENENGGRTFDGYPTPSTGANVLETALDVEWVHALAPGASILLVETQSNGPTDLFTAVKTAENTSGVSVLSMSWGFGGDLEAEGAKYDQYFQTPSGHTPIVFLAAAGDSGGVNYPATSPNVLAVGGTTLTMDTMGDWQSEVTWNDAWGKTGGGPSALEPQPAYQYPVITSSTRTTPDVSFASDENISGNSGNPVGVWVYDSADSNAEGYSGEPWIQVVGTSFSVLGWAAMTSEADQLRTSRPGLSNLNGPSQAIELLYQIPKTDYHDITTGGNGTYNAGTGYDEVTGWGSPLANDIVPAATTGINPTANAMFSPGQTGVVGTSQSATQYLFSVGSNDLMSEQTLNTSTHQASSKSIVDSHTSFPKNAFVTAFSDGLSLNVFAVNSGGQAEWSQQEIGSGVWSPFITLDSFAGSPTYYFAPGTKLVGFTLPGQLDLFGVGTDGYIRQYQYVTSTNVWSKYDFNADFNFPSSAQLGLWESGGVVNLFGVLSNGQVAQGQFTSNWSWYNDGGTGANFPSGAPLAVWLTSSGGDLFGVSANGGVGQMEWTGSTWASQVVNAGTGIFSPQTSLAVYDGYGDGDDYVFGINSSGKRVEVKGTGGYSGYWVAEVGTAGFASSAAMTLDVAGMDTQYFAISPNGWPAEFDEPQGPNGQEGYYYALSPVISPAASVTVSSQVVAVTGTYQDSPQQMFTVGSDGLIREDEMYYSLQHAATGQSVLVDPNTTFAVGTEIVSYTDGASTNLFAIGKDGHLMWDQERNDIWSSFVDVDSLIPGSSFTFSAGTNLVGSTVSGLLNLFAIGSDGYLKQYEYATSTNTWQSYNFPSSSKFNAGSQLTISAAPGIINLFGVLPSGDIGQVEYTTSGGWQSYDDGGAGLGIPAGAPLTVWAGGTYVDVFGVSNGGIAQMQWTSSKGWSAVGIFGAHIFGSGTSTTVYEAGGTDYIYGVNTAGAMEIGPVRNLVSGTRFGYIPQPTFLTEIHAWMLSSNLRPSNSPANSPLKLRPSTMSTACSRC